MEQVIRRLQELVDAEGYAPSKDRWDEQRGDTLPSALTIVKHGYLWADLVERAGLKRSPPGNRPGSKPPGRVHFQEKPVPEETEAFIRNAFATAEPPRPSTWPLSGIPTRTQTFRGRLPDGTEVQVTRQYYSLR